MRLDEKLKNISSYPFHMPGHKRNSGLSICGEDIDITEIDGFDNLHFPTGILKELEEKFALLYGAERSMISVNGSTGGILSAVSAVSKRGGEILLAANCHKSVFNACRINGLDAYFIEPEYNAEFACWGQVTQKSVDEALKAHPNACAVVITSPTYEGIVSRITCDVPLIVDAAHGAHFGFADWLPEQAKGDIVITSLHKTLPSLTQTALINIYNAKFVDPVKKYMDIFETSSPSYVLLDSVDKCADFLSDCDHAFREYKKRLELFYEKAEDLENVDILKNDDPTRIIISVRGYTGTELSEILREGFNTEAEGASLKYVILISTVCDSQDGFDRLLAALGSLDKREQSSLHIPKPIIPKKMSGAFDPVKTIPLPIDECAGKVCAEYVYAYPPGSPVLVPGELIRQENAEHIIALIKNNVNVLSDTALLPLKILTKQ